MDNNAEQSAQKSSIGEAFTKFIQVRDELSFRNTRGAIWPVIIIFPLSVIAGDLRYFDLGIEFAAFQSYELMLFAFGIGWLVLSFIPQKLIIPILRLAALLSIILIPFQFLLTDSTAKLAVFMAFQLSNGICAACAFSLFCFKLNNIERLLGLAFLQLYYGFYYTLWKTIPAVEAVSKGWAGVLVVAVVAVSAFFCREDETLSDTKSDGKGSGVPFVICLGVVYYMLMCTMNYIDEAKNFSMSGLAFGLGNIVSIIIILIVQLRWSRSALQLFFFFLVFSLLGLGIVFVDSPFTLLGGSFMYGIGDSLGYIMIYYLCAGTIRKSKSMRMFRLFCFFFFIEKFVVSGIVSRFFASYEVPNLLLAFIIVLILSYVCFMLMPIIRKKFFETDWTDGIHLSDVEEYKKPLAEIEAINIKDNLNLTPRESEILTLILKGSFPKEIGYTLKISYSGVNFHIQNIYRKFGIQSRTELLAKFIRTPD